MIAMQEDLLLNLEEVAQRLRVTAYTVRKYITRGDLEAVRVGGRWKVRQTALDRYIDRNTKPENNK